MKIQKKCNAMIIDLRNQAKINCVTGGKHCHTFVVANNLDNFNFIKGTIKGVRATPGIISKPNDNCYILDKIFTGLMRIHAGDEIIECDCKDKYEENSLFIVDPEGHILKHE